SDTIDRKSRRNGSGASDEEDVMFKASVLIPLLIAPTAVSAQPQDPPRKTLIKSGMLGDGLEPGIYSKSRLLKGTLYQEELKLTPAQKERLKEGEKEVGRIDARRSEEQIQALQALKEGNGQPFESFKQQRRAEMYSL